MVCIPGGSAGVFCFFPGVSGVAGLAAADSGFLAAGAVASCESARHADDPADGGQRGDDPSGDGSQDAGVCGVPVSTAAVPVPDPGDAFHDGRKPAAVFL